MTLKLTQRNMWKDIANLQIKRLNNFCNVATPCTDDHQVKEEENESVGELSTVCSQIVLKCLYLARIGRLDILWSVNKLACAITKWTKSCDKRLARLISYIHHTSEFRQYWYAGNTAQQCRLELFQDSDFAGDMEDSKSTSGGILCILGSHTFVPKSWCARNRLQFHTVLQKLKSFFSMQVHAWTVFPLSHSVIWWLKYLSPYRTELMNPRESHGEVKPNMHSTIPIKHTNVIPTNIDHIPSNTTHSGHSARLYVFEDKRQ